MVAVSGPLQGWGLQNMLLDGVNVATIGVAVQSAQFGDCQNLAILNCISEQIGSNTVALFSGINNTDSLHNAWRNIYLVPSNIAGVKGVVLTGNAASNSDTDLNVFDNLFIAFPPSEPGYGIYLQNCDGNQFRNVLFAGGSAASIGVLFDYTNSVGGVFPAGNGFYGIDTNGNVLGVNQWVNFGTPGGAAPNFVRGIYPANGATNPNLPNLIPDVPTVFSPNVLLIGQTATIGGTNIVEPIATGLYRISIYLALESLGNNVTVAASVGWNDSSGPRVFSTAAINFNTGSNNPQEAVILVVATQRTRSLIPRTSPARWVPVLMNSRSLSRD